MKTTKYDNKTKNGWKRRKWNMTDGDNKQSSYRLHCNALICIFGYRRLRDARLHAFWVAILEYRWLSKSTFDIRIVGLGFFISILNEGQSYEN